MLSNNETVLVKMKIVQNASITQRTESCVEVQRAFRSGARGNPLSRCVVCAYIGGEKAVAINNGINRLVYGVVWLP